MVTVSISSMGRNCAGSLFRIYVGSTGDHCFSDDVYSLVFHFAASCGPPSLIDMQGTIWLNLCQMVSALC